MNTYGLSQPIAAIADTAGAPSLGRTGRCLDILVTMATAERAGTSAARSKRRTVARAKRSAKSATARVASDDRVRAGESASDGASDETASDEALPTASDAGRSGTGETPTVCADAEDSDGGKRAEGGRGKPRDGEGEPETAGESSCASGDAPVEAEAAQDASAERSDPAAQGERIPAPERSASESREDAPAAPAGSADSAAQGARGEREGSAAVRNERDERQTQGKRVGRDAEAPQDPPDAEAPQGSDDGHPPLSTLSSKQIGQRGEEAAARFLKNKGYRILDRNWKCPAGEADIVAMDCEVLVFIEVKTRTSIDAGMPEEAITPEKRSRYERIAAYYLRDFRSVEMPIRFDVIGILVVAEDRAILKHHINAFAVA